MAGSNSVFILVSVDYLKSTFEEFQVSKGTRAVPDVASHLEKVDEASLRPLSPESYSRFRKGLGRLLWLSQTRSDIKAWLSLIGSQQSKPTQGTEAALKSVLRFMFGDGDVVLELPTPCDLVIDFGTNDGENPAFLQVFTDASSERRLRSGDLLQEVPSASCIKTTTGHGLKLLRGNTGRP